MTNAKQLAYKAGYAAGLQASRKSSVKVLDIGAAIDQLNEMKDDLDTMFKKYYGIEQAIENSYREGHTWGETLDQNFFDQFDRLQGEANIELQKAGFAVGNLVKALENAEN